MDDWTLAYPGFDSDHEGLREVLCTLGNGFFATRGALQEAAADGVHYPATYLAGCYNRLVSEVAGRRVENEDLVNAPNWLILRYRIEGGPWLLPEAGNCLDYRQQLDLRQGVLSHRYRLRDAAGRITRVESRRLVHMAEPHLAAIETRITAENWSGELELLSALDGGVRNAGVERYRALRGEHWLPCVADADDGYLHLEVETSQSHVRVAQAARTRLFLAGRRRRPRQRSHSEPSYAGETLALRLGQGQTLRVEKVVAMYSSRDRAISAPGLEADAAVQAAPGFGALQASHRRAWEQLWRRFDLELACQAEPADSLLLLRLHIFHLLQVASPNLQHVDAGVPARGLHGEAYRGHVFWDELFILPSLTFRMPEIARALLMYRWYRLGAARAEARAAGRRGAQYPWQSGSNGREETQRLHLNPRSGRWLPDNSHRQRHVGLAIAYNVWQYYEVTGDHEFLAAYGAEMLLEIARYWADLAEFNPDSDRYEIRGVMGPDEYHEGYPDDPEPRGIDNNAYSNVMASWLLRRALAVLEELADERRRDLLDSLELSPAELERWQACARGLRVDFHQGHIISQFQGYQRLAELDWAGYRERYGDIQRLDRILEAEGDSPNRYKLSKQADVLMLFYLFSAEQLEELFGHLGYRFEAGWIPDNVRYYARRTAHGSSLSRVVHAWVLSRSRRTESWNLFRQALCTDYGDQPRGTTREGIHLGAMAGTIDLAFRCYAGLEVREGALWFKPRLPREVERLCMQLQFRDRAVRLELDAARLTVSVSGRGSAPVQVGVRERLYAVAPGETRRLPLGAV